jgi:hypothetical protein
MGTWYVDWKFGSDFVGSGLPVPQKTLLELHLLLGTKRWCWGAQRRLVAVNDNNCDRSTLPLPNRERLGDLLRSNKSWWPRGCVGDAQGLLP